MKQLLKSKIIKNEQKERILKGSYESIYLIDVKLIKNNFKLKLTGSTLNIYTITLDKNYLTCNCLDSKKFCLKNNLYCKHICFILLFIGKFTTENVFTFNVLSSETKIQLIKNIKHEYYPKDIVSCPYLIDKYNDKIKNNIIFKNIENNNINSTCGVCQNEIKDNKYVLVCPKCNNLVHKKCILKWLKYNNNCVYCRDTIWKNYSNQGYLNINN